MPGLVPGPVAPLAPPPPEKGEPRFWPQPRAKAAARAQLVAKAACRSMSTCQLVATPERYAPVGALASRSPRRTAVQNQRCGHRSHASDRQLRMAANPANRNPEVTIAIDCLDAHRARFVAPFARDASNLA